MRRKQLLSNMVQDNKSLNYEIFPQNYHNYNIIASWYYSDERLDRWSENNCRTVSYMINNLIS